MLQLNNLFPKYSLAGSNPAYIKVRAGSSTHDKDGELYAVKRIVYHNKFITPRLDYDFALLELQEPIQFDETKQPIKLPNFDDIFPDNTTTLVSGWGDTKNSSESRLQLRAGEI